MASIHQRTRKDGTTIHRVAFRIDGRQAQESFADPIAAEEFKRLVERVGGRDARRFLMAQDDDLTSSIPTLREWTAQYLDPDSGLLTGIARDTRDNYARMAERSFLERLGEAPIHTITERDVRIWVNWQSEQKLKRRVGTVSAKTIANYHGLLSSILSSAAKEGLIERNPASRIDLPRSRRPSITFLSEAEFARVYAYIPAQYQPMALALAGSGLRFSELSALTWGDLVEMDGGWCFDVNKAWKEGQSARRHIGPPKSDAGVRLVSVSDEIVEALGERKQSSLPIFSSARGNPVSSGTFGTCGLAKGVESAGLVRKPRVHDLRHSHASWLIARNVPLPYIQKRLGHEKIDTTVSVYGHLLPEALSATRDAATEAIRKALA